MVGTRRNVTLTPGQVLRIDTSVPHLPGHLAEMSLFAGHPKDDLIQRGRIVANVRHGGWVQLVRREGDWVRVRTTIDHDVGWVHGFFTRELKGGFLGYLLLFFEWVVLARINRLLVRVFFGSPRR